MSIEQNLNYQLNKYPAVKVVVKSFYQHVMVLIANNPKSLGNIIKVSPNDPTNEYFFGYYDKSPWDATDRYMLCLRAKDTWSDVSPRDVADILLIDTAKDENDKDRYTKIAETRAWNVQQACMLQWLGSDYKSRVIYNDFRNGKYCSVILNIHSGEERIIDAPVYTVSADGKYALTLDFSRLYNLRPGYGYYNKKEDTEGVALPDTTCIWKIDLENGYIEPLLKYTDFALFQPRPEMIEEGSVHKVNHLMLSPNGKRFMVLYRWFNGQRKYTRLVTCNVDGSDMYVLSDDDMVSHCYWKNDEYILAFENKNDGGPGYYLMKDRTQEYTHCWPQFSNDGHPSYSPDKSLIVTDSYPDRARIASINIMDGDESKTENSTVARVFAPFRYDNDTRCDLHPRWNHAGNKICFDSVFEGHRGLYVVEIPATYERRVLKNNVIENRSIKYSIITPMYNSFSLMKRFFDSLEKQSYKNFEVIIIDDCSCDDSYAKACDYAKKTDLDITVIRVDQNKGPGNARNIGMEYANGDWVTFVDNDDWISSELLKKVNKIIESNDINCVIYDYFTTDGENEKAQSSMYKGSSGVLSMRECMMYVRNHAVGKFYKKDCLNNVRYPLLRRCEDVAFVCRAIDACGSAYYLKEPLYYYYQRRESLSNNSSLDEKDMVAAFAIIEEYLGKKYPKEIIEKSIPDLLYGGLLMLCKSGKRSVFINNYIDKYEEKYFDWYNCDNVKNLGKAKYIFLIMAKYRCVLGLRILSWIHTKLIG